MLPPQVGQAALGEGVRRPIPDLPSTWAPISSFLGDHAGFQASLAEALALERADASAHIVVVGDGAPWVWTLGDALCPTALQVLDYPHAVQHAAEAAQALFPPAPGLDRLLVATIERALLAEQIDELFHGLEACAFAARGRDLAALATCGPLRLYVTLRSDLRPTGSYN